MTASKEKTTIKPIALTSGALKELKRIREEQNIPDDHGLRVGVKGGGCSGFSYILGFDVEKENDGVYEVDGLKVYIERSSALYLFGIEIDG